MWAILTSICTYKIDLKPILKMNSIKPNPRLIPRFNIDYYTGDFLSSMLHLDKRSDVGEIANLFADVSINYTNSGRTSLYIILKALNLPENSNIGVSLYTCPSDFDAIIHAGHNPVFIDIEPDNYTLDPQDLNKKIDDLAAVVVVHALGRPADLEGILKVVGDKPVIEDCAHALLSRYKGRLVGTIATAGFFSFRTGKYISAGEGGMITTKDLQLASNIGDEIEKLPLLPITDEIKHATITYARSLLYHRPWFGLFSLPLGSRIEEKIDIMNKRSFSKTKIRNTDLHVITKKIKDFQGKVDKTRNNSLYLIEQLKDLDLILPVERSETYCNYFLFPIQLKNISVRDNLSEALRKAGFDTIMLFSATPEIAKLSYGYEGDCPATENVAKRLLVMPNHYTLGKKELDNICKIIKICIR
ncbi:MAG: hypothetical protein GQ576_03905 [Methanococcoides sp.]|nr:hypothetical protein [Methanococcoides sp.]